MLKKTASSWNFAKAALLFIFALISTSPARAAGWTNRTASPKNLANTPTPRYWSAMAYDDERGRVVMFGGYGPGGHALADTWEWDGVAWHNVTPSNPAAGPAARYRHAMAYDSVRGKVVLFGGHGVAAADSTWEWDGATWANVTPATGRPPAGVAAMTYDAARAKTVAYLDQPATWERDATTWAPVVPSSSLVDRVGTAMAYAGGGKSLLFGGTRESQKSLDDTWTFDGTTWMQLSGTHPPERRVGHAMAYDRTRNRVVMFGGHDFRESTPGAVNWSQVWEWNGLVWNSPATIPSPPAVSFAAMCESGDGKVLLFGGQDGDGAALDDTWEYEGSALSGVTFNLSGPETAAPGDNVTYTIAVGNNGTIAGSASFTDVLPAGMTFVSLDAPDWTTSTPAVGSDGTVTLSKSIAPGESQTVHLVAQVAPTSAPGEMLSNSLSKAESFNDTMPAARSVTVVTTVTAAPSLVVTTLADTTADDGETSLREAIAYANFNADANTITFAPGLDGTIQLTSPLPDLRSALSIQGPGARILSVRAMTNGYIFHVHPLGDSNINFAISGLSLIEGGSAVLNGANLIVSNCAILNNHAFSAAGSTTYGGAIINTGTLLVENCTLSGNSADIGSAIASYPDVTGRPVALTIRNSTISGNQVTGGTPFFAGAVIESGNPFNVSGDLSVSVVIENSTVVNNTIKFPGSDVTGGIRIRLGSYAVSNSLIAGNTSYDINRVGGTVIDGGFNVIGNNRSVETTFPAGAATGTALAPLDAKVGPLANNGGPTDTNALLDASPALNSGNPAVAPSDDTFDQRGPGFPRIVGGRLDSGAFEAETVSVTVTPGSPASFNESEANPVTKVRVTRTGPTAAAALVALSTASQRIKVPVKVNIPAGQSFVDVLVTAVDDDWVDGATDAVIVASSPGYSYLFDPAGTLHITDDDGTAPDLMSTLAPIVFAENKPGTLSLTLSHNRALLTEVPVTLASADARLHWPAIVKFPAGSRKITVPLTVTADPGIQGTTVSKINITSGGFVGSSVSPVIYDVQSALSLAVAPGSPATFSEGAGSGATLVRVERNTPTTAAVAVDLSVRTGAGRIAVPARVTIPVGQAFIDVPVRALENTVYENNQRVQVAAAAAGYTGVPVVTLTVTENDPPPALRASLNPTAFYENRATTVALTVTHNRAGTGTAVPLTLKTADLRLSWPAGLAIPAGSRSVVVPLTVTPNSSVEGTVKTEIIVSGPAFTPARGTVATIYDVQAAITAAIAPGSSSTFDEGAGEAATKIRISRNTPVSGAVLVSLTVKRGAGQISIPTSVTIPAGKVFIDLPVAAVDDSEGDGSQPVIISILGERYPAGAAVNLVVLDNDNAAPAAASPIAAPASPYALSSASASAGRDTLTLTFTGPLSAGAGDPANYSITANGAVVPVISAARKSAATVELTVEQLTAGSAVTIAYNLTDTNGRPLRGTARVSAR